MNPKSRSKLVAALLAGGIVVLGGGGVLAATLPSMGDSSTVAASPSTIAARMATQTAAAQSAPAASTSPATTATTGAKPPSSASSATSTTASAKPSSSKKTPAKRATRTAFKTKKASSITYTVKRGDTLSGIAGWFKLRGYGSLYAWNKSVIGKNPNLIFAGQRITVGHGVMTVQKTGR